MREIMGKIILPVTLLLSLFIGSHLFALTACADDNRKAKPVDGKLLTRIDFGNSYITGQTLKSGAVYLLQRKKNSINTMLKYRDNYRKEILESHNLDITDSKSNEPYHKGFVLND